MIGLLAAFLLGFVAGLRTLTAPAVLLLVRHRSLVAYVLGALAVLEYVGDLQPSAPARTQAVSLAARVVSGAFCGGSIALMSRGSVLLGALLGAAGAVTGAYIGLAARSRAIASFGRVPAALLEDAVAIAGAVLIVVYL